MWPPYFLDPSCSAYCARCAHYNLVEAKPQRTRAAQRVLGFSAPQGRRVIGHSLEPPPRAAWNLSGRPGPTAAVQQGGVGVRHAGRCAVRPSREQTRTCGPCGGRAPAARESARAVAQRAAPPPPRGARLLFTGRAGPAPPVPRDAPPILAAISTTCPLRPPNQRGSRRTAAQRAQQYKARGGGDSSGGGKMNACFLYRTRASTRPREVQRRGSQHDGGDGHPV